MDKAHLRFSRNIPTPLTQRNSRIISGNFRIALLLIIFAFSILSLSCTSRYRLDLFMTLDQERNRVKVEESIYIENSRLNSPDAESKILRGSEAVIVVKTGTRGKLVETATSNLFGYDEYLRCKLFIQLSPELTEGAISDKELSFVQILGRFEQEAETKLFLYDEGSLVVDSTTAKHIYLSLGASFRNISDQILIIDGVVKIKKR